MLELLQGKVINRSYIRGYIELVCRQLDLDFFADFSDFSVLKLKLDLCVTAIYIYKYCHLWQCIVCTLFLLMTTA